MLRTFLTRNLILFLASQIYGIQIDKNKAIYMILNIHKHFFRPKILLSWVSTI